MAGPRELTEAQAAAGLTPEHADLVNALVTARSPAVAMIPPNVQQAATGTTPTSMSPLTALAHFLGQTLMMRGGMGNPGGWRYPPPAQASIQYKHLGRGMSQAGGSLRESNAAAQVPIDVEGLQMLGLKARPGRPALSPIPPLLAQPSESGAGRIAFGRAKTGEYDTGGDLFFDLIKQLFRRGVEQR